VLTGQGRLLRVFVGESDKHEGLPLYEWIVRKAKENGLSGATVIRGIQGFGSHSRIHAAKILDLSVELPLIVEIVGQPEEIERFMPLVDSAVTEGLVTVSPVEIRLNRSKNTQS